MNRGIQDRSVNTEEEEWIRRALILAAEAAERGEIPVAAIVVGPDGFIAGAANSVEELGDPTAHAEILAIRKAVAIVGDKRLLGTTLYVTLEPCAMCAGAIVLSRIARVVFSTFDPKTEHVALGNVLQDSRLNHRCEVVGDVLARESSNMLKGFFTSLRHYSFVLERCRSGRTGWSRNHCAIMVTEGLNPPSPPLFVCE